LQPERTLNVVNCCIAVAVVALLLWGLAALLSSPFFSNAPWSPTAVAERASVAQMLLERERALQAMPPEELARRAAEEAAQHALLFTDQCQICWEWMSTLCSPATLVAGAALASFFELRNHLVPVDSDSRRIKIGKSLVLIMLLMSFASEIACVFLGSITGDQVKKNPHHHHHHQQQQQQQQQQQKQQQLCSFGRIHFRDIPYIVPFGCCPFVCLRFPSPPVQQLMANNDVPAPAVYGFLEDNSWTTGSSSWGRGTGKINCMAASPMGMMHRELEFEFLASRVGFFHGILLWLGALSVELWVSGATINAKTADFAMIQRKKLLYAASASTTALLVWMLAFFK